MKMTFESIEHHRAENSQLIDEIVAIKQESWPHSYSSQRQWIADNLQADDVHCLLRLDGKLIAYANLIHIRASDSIKQFESLGLGNVCTSTDFRGVGLGRIIRDIATLAIKQESKPGMLLCRDDLVNYYLGNSSWKTLGRDTWKIASREINANLLVMDSPAIFVPRLTIDRLF